MKKIINYIFHEAPTIPNIIGDDHTSMVLNTSSDFGIFIFFLIIAILCFTSAKKNTPQEAYSQRKKITYFIGLSMGCCAISRGLNVLALWHNYYFINGIVKSLGTIFSFLAIFYVPYVFKAIKNARELDKIKNIMNETSKKVDELKVISSKVIDKEK